MKKGYMKLKPNHIKLLREQKAWSQSHLAQVSALSLRTVQRIEKENSASQESVKALASVFELSAAELLDKTPNTKAWLPVASFGFLLMVAMVYFWPIQSTAENVTLDISASIKKLEIPTSTDFPELFKELELAENLYTLDSSILLKEKERTVIKVNEHVEMGITAFFVENEKILLTARIVDTLKDAKPVIANSKIITDNHVEAVLVVNDEETGSIYKVGITPHR